MARLVIHESRHDDFRYSAEDAAKIVSSLPLKSRDAANAALKHIEYAAGFYLDSIDAEKRRLRPSILAAACSEAVEAIDKLLASFNNEAVFDLIEADIRERQGLSDFQWNVLTAELATVRQAFSSAKAEKLKERKPRKVAIRIFLGMLSDTWLQHTTTPITRRHDYLSGKDYGPFHAFVQACLKPIDPIQSSHGLNDYIRVLIGNIRSKQLD